MKVSYLCSNTIYCEALKRPGWPTPRELYRTDDAARAQALNFDLVRLADDLGFDWVSTSEHHYSPRILAPNPFVISAALSQIVRRVKIAVLGPLVAMSNPVRVAEELALLDQLSGGRCIVLFLRGTPSEFLSYGVNPDETRARTQEATMLIVRALTEERPFGWIGRYFRFRTVSVWPGTVQQPHPPFYYSGNSKESASFAAAERLGMGISFYPTAFAAQLTRHYREECARHGWEPSPEHLVYRCRIAVGEDEKEVAVLRAGLLATADAPGGGLYSGRGGNVELPIAARPGMGLDEVRFCGDPDTVVRQIEEFYAATGMGVIDLIFTAFTGALSFEQTAKSMRLFASHVLPRIRDLGESAGPRRVAAAEPVGAAQ